VYKLFIILYCKFINSEVISNCGIHIIIELLILIKMKLLKS